MKWTWQFAIVCLSILGLGLYGALWLLHAPYADVPLMLVIILGGFPFVIQIVRDLFRGQWGADLLAAIAILAGLWLGETLAASLIVLMLASGQYLEQYAMRKASGVLYALSQRMPRIAHRDKNNQISDVSLENLEIDDEIVIYPHEICPTDGVVIFGNGSMDESYLTGEPYQMSKAPGSSVLSGAMNGISVLRIRVSALPSDSRYAAMVSVLTEAEHKRPQLRRLADAIGAIFSPLASLIAIAAGLLTHDSLRFLAVLVIATPCPLLIAIPITLMSAISMAAKNAIVIKDPLVLERLPTCETAIFDKTGTLTYGRPELTQIMPSEKTDKRDILQLAASVERYSKHPLSAAVLKAAKKAGLSLLEPSELTEKPGMGLSAKINGQKIQLTSRKKTEEFKVQGHEQLPLSQPGLECVILIDEVYKGIFYFHDEPRPDSQSFIGHLGPKHQFKKIMLVSGDRESEVAYLARLLSVDNVRFSQTPEQKLAIVREESALAPTVFMGDGINDAPALTAATVGIAFGEYSDITAHAASAVIMENRLSKVDELMHLSIKTRQIALQSGVGGMLFSFIGMGFAAFGFISPVMGAIFQELIDVFAIINALRLIWGQRIAIDLPINE